MTVAISKLCASDEGFDQTLEKLIAWDMVSDTAVEETVSGILRQVRTQGDQALIEFTNRFDRRQVETINQLSVSAEQLQEALQSIDSESRQALETAATRIRDYHNHQTQESWQYQEADGTTLRATDYPVGSRGNLCARRQGQLSLFSVDELYSRPGCRCSRGDYDGARAGC